MRLLTDDKIIERQSKIARYATFGGLAVLAGSLFVSFTENYLLAYASLIVGFILAYVGATLANRWIKEPRGDHALAKALKGFDNKYQLYNFLPPVPHYLVTPTGVLVFKIKSLDGEINCVNGRWNRPWKMTRLFGGMGQEPLGNPLADLHAEIEKVKKFIADKMPNAALVPVDGYVVFTDPKVQLSIDDPALPVVTADNLKETLRKSKHGAVLPPQTQDNLAKIFSQDAHGETTE
ncbi:MAG: NERD domain-containing protein [Chloroflexi bacterium]|nr:NERD domain-containing protein [Chloroflexota bacterium]